MPWLRNLWPLACHHLHEVVGYPSWEDVDRKKMAGPGAAKLIIGLQWVFLYKDTMGLKVFSSVTWIDLCVISTISNVAMWSRMGAHAGSALFRATKSQGTRINEQGALLIHRLAIVTSCSHQM